MTKLIKQIHIVIIIFIVALLISGVTAFPLNAELQWLANIKPFSKNSPSENWLEKVAAGVKDIQTHYPFIFYGFDWLAFAHIVIAILFIGVYKHPVRNRWVIDWAMITCVCVLPLALIAGNARDIPIQHTLFDCSFGIIGLIPLRIMQVKIKKLHELKKMQTSNSRRISDK